MDKRLQKIVDANFKMYPNRDVQYIFTDGNCYFRKGQADDYAKSSGKKYETVKREVSKAKESDDNGGAGGSDDSMTKEQALEILKTLELNKDSNYDLLGQLIDVLELETEGKSKADRIKALETVKAELTEGDNE